MTSERDVAIPTGQQESRMDGPVHCICCSTTFSSQLSLHGHFPCSNSSYDLARVKTEIQDSDQGVGTEANTSQKISQVHVANNVLDIANMKTEVKLESPDASEIIDSDATWEEVTCRDLMVINRENGKTTESVGQRREFTIYGSRGRGGQRGRMRRQMRRLPKILSIAPKTTQQLAGINVTPVFYAGAAQLGRSILPKVTNDNKSSGGNSLKIDSVYFTQSFKNTKNLVKLVSAAHGSIPSVDAGTVICSPGAKTTAVMPNTFTLNTLAGTGGLPSLTGQKIGGLPFQSFILGSNILQNSQQDPLILSSSTSLVNPLTNVNTLQTPSLVTGVPAFNLPQPLTNLQNLNIPLNHNTALGVHQNMPQVFSAGTQSSAVFHSNANQTVGSAVSPSQQISCKVPVLVGNQIVLMDLPVQYMTAVSLANTPATRCLSSFIQSPQPFSSTITPTTVTHQSVAGAVSTPAPHDSVFARNIHLQPVLTTTQSTIASQQPHPQTLTINSGQEICESAMNLKSPPPLILVVSSASQSQTQTGPKMCTTDLGKNIFSEKNISETKTSSPSCDIRAWTEESKNISETKTSSPSCDIRAWTEESKNTHTIVNANSLQDKEISSGRSETPTATRKKSLAKVYKKTDLQCNPAQTSQFRYAVSNSKQTSLTTEMSPSLITSNIRQPIMSADVNSGTLISTGLSLVNTSGINIVPHSSASSVIQQPSILSHNIQHGSMSVNSNNAVNIGTVPGLTYFQNTLSVPRLNFSMHKSSGQNIWIQSSTDNQPLVVGCEGNQHQLFLNSPVGDLVNNHAINPISSESSSTSVAGLLQKTSSPKHKTIKVSALNESPYGRKTLKRNMLSIKMMTPDSMERIFISDKKRKNFHLEVNASGSSDGIVSLGFAESQREAKTVKEMLQTKLGFKQVTNVANTTANPSPNQCSMLAENKTTAGFLKNQTVYKCDNNFTNASVDNNDLSQLNDGVICKIAEVKSIADLIPKSEPDLSVFLNGNKLNGVNCTKDTQFVGPLTKEQLDKIILNPSELGKYVSVPSGHVLLSKALVVPAASSDLMSPVTFQRSLASCETIAYSAVTSYAAPGNQESTFVKICPKPMTETVQSSRAVTDTCSAVALFPQTYLSTATNVSNPTIKNVFTASIKDLGDSGKAIKIEMNNFQIEQSNKISLNCSRGIRKRKFLSEKRRQELKFNTSGESPKSAIMKLSFLGDLTLLKDALRRSTVPLQILNTDSESLADAVCHYNSQVKIIQKSLETDLSDSSKDDYKPALVKKKWRNRGQKKVVRTRKKKRKLGEHTQKQWVPEEVVGDLAIRGRLLEGELEDEDKSFRGGTRRSNRISAKPRLDYADLESLPFKDLDEELEESDSDCQSQRTPLQSPQSSPSPPILSPAAPSPPILSPAVAYMQNEGCDVRTTYVRSSPNVDNDINIPVLTSEVIEDGDCMPQAKELEDCYYSSESESDMFDSSVQACSKSDKKKMAWKQHSEITMFLVKHAGKFHSDDEKSEHYCNICHKYKTNGIFCLSRHLKKHLSGSLKCSHCVFEACHEQNLAEHQETLH